MSAQTFAQPEQLSEVLALLADPNQVAIPVAGGTSLTRGSRRNAKILVDITRCGLDQQHLEDDQFVLGATLRCHDIARSKLPGASGQMLCEVADGIATQPLRNAITLGGNIVNMVSWADFPVALLALDANIVVEQQDQNPLILPMQQLVKEHPLRALPKGSLLTRVLVPRHSQVAGQHWGSAYRRFRQSEPDYALASVAVLVQIKDKKVQDIAISVGSVTPRPQRCPQAEALLKGQSPSRARLDKAVAAALQEVRIMPNFRMADDVRARILGVEIRRAIETAAQRAEQGE